MELVDTHCHLNVAPLAQVAGEAMQRAREAGVSRVVVPAYDLASWDDIQALARRERGVFPALGIHPWVAAEPLDAATLSRALKACGAVAVGEIGLDFAIAAADRRRQTDLLAIQLEVAIDLELPIILHCRQAFDELLALLRPHAPRLRGVVHAFSRGADLARRFLALGLHIAFGGAVTRPRANRAQRAARAVPDESLLLETDAPSLGIEGVPPEDAEPRHALNIALALAALRGTTLDAIAGQTTANARALFRLP